MYSCALLLRYNNHHFYADCLHKTVTQNKFTITNYANETQWSCLLVHWLKKLQFSTAIFQVTYQAISYLRVVVAQVCYLINRSFMKTCIIPNSTAKSSMRGKHMNLTDLGVVLHNSFTVLSYSRFISGSFKLKIFLS